MCLGDPFMPFTLLRHRDHTGRRSPIRVVLSALVLALLIPLTTVLATPASAVDGTVSGIVYDEAGDGVAGVEVSIYKILGGAAFFSGDR